MEQAVRSRCAERITWLTRDAGVVEAVNAERMRGSERRLFLDSVEQAACRGAGQRLCSAATILCRPTEAD